MVESTVITSSCMACSSLPITELVHSLVSSVWIDFCPIRGYVNYNFCTVAPIIHPPPSCTVANRLASSSPIITGINYPWLVRTYLFMELWI